MNPAMQDRAEELAALCAAGAASATERAELESLAAQDPGVRDIMRGYADAASFLALDLVPLGMPAGSLDAIRRRLVPSPAVPASVPPVGRSSGSGGDIIPLAGRKRRPGIAVMVALPLAAAAGFAFLWLRERDRGTELAGQVAQLAVQVDTERGVRTRVERQLAAVQGERDEFAGTLRRVTSPSLQLATAGDPKGVVLKMLIDPLTGSWYVMAFQLPAVDRDKQDYQLWFVDKRNPDAPVPSEVFHPGAAGALQTLTVLPPGVDPIGAAVSLERKGGSTTGKPDKVIGGGAFL